MQFHQRVHQDLVEHLYEAFYKAFPHKITREQQSLADRIRRSLSWIHRATRVSQEDKSSRFVDLWIALNALYGYRPYDEGFKPDEKRDFQHFLRRLRSIDTEGDLSRLMKRIEKRTYGLIENKYLWKEFWRGRFEVQKKRRKASDKSARKPGPVAMSSRF